jgi:rare lipoprotein A
MWFAKMAGLVAALMLTSPVHQASPQPLPKAKVQSGIASWYGPGFHGRKTSSGERFDQNGFTLACKVLPVGTHVKIVNLENGKTCTGRINDRGPRVKGRSFDVSKAIAVKLGFVQEGKARIKVTTIRKEVAIQTYGDEPMRTCGKP